jgi:predicted MPP superfamily phosphohydrolase
MVKENLHTAIEIIDKSIIKISFDLVKYIRKLLANISEEHLEGLDSIILVDRLLGTSHRDDPFLYRKESKPTPANIELSLNGFYQDNPKVFSLIPFLRKMAPAIGLYQAVGNHYSYIKGDVSKNERKRFIKEFFKTYFRKTFPISVRIIKLFRPAILRFTKEDGE